MVELLASETVRHARPPETEMLGNLALHHLLAACRFSAIVAQIEQDNAGRPLGAFWEEILHNSLGVAALTVTFLEGYANDLGQEGSALVARRAPATVSRSAEAASTDGILGKYSTALMVRTGHGLDFSAAEVRNVAALIKLRNEVVRLRAEWSGRSGRYDELSVELGELFSPSDFFPGESVLPRAWASYGFATWALKSTLAFLEYVYAQAGEPCPVAQFRQRLTELCGRIA